MSVRVLPRIPPLPPLPAKRRPFAEMHKLLTGLGFVPGVPAWLSPESARADRLICGTMRCAGCRAKGQRYRPYHRAHDMRYRVLAVCGGCGGAEEF